MHYLTSDEDEKEWLCRKAYSARLFRLNGLMRGWLQDPDYVKHIALLVNPDDKNNIFIGVGMITMTDTLSLYVRTKYRKRGLGSDIINQLLSMTKDPVYGKPDWDPCYDNNEKFWDKMADRNKRIRLR